MPSRIVFTPNAEDDLAHFKIADRRTIIGAIRDHLTADADVESRRRKRLTANPTAPWELRVGDHRVFYEIEDVATVTILAVGINEHNILFIRGRRVEL